MSQPNPDSNIIRVNEQGEVIINNPKLAKAVQELSDKELAATDDIVVNIYQCGKAVAADK
jgi:hypothetical protein